ncbi:hypothetical protein [Nonomuraea sp. NPDC049695]|uniref:hypothetical protein n=1 Tax=Nonomuraea sp. NPDC049695 TaxID=3154734 RepID=UPI0034120BC0
MELIRRGIGVLAAAVAIAASGAGVVAAPAQAESASASANMEVWEWVQHKTYPHTAAGYATCLSDGRRSGEPWQCTDEDVTYYLWLYRKIRDAPLPLHAS